MLAWCFRDFRIISAANERDASDVSRNERRGNKKKVMQTVTALPVLHPTTVLREHYTRLCPAKPLCKRFFFIPNTFFLLPVFSTENTCRSSLTLSYVIFREFFIFLCIHFIFVCRAETLLRKAPERPVRNTFVTGTTTRVTYAHVSPLPPLLRVCLTSPLPFAPSRRFQT